MMDRVSTAGTYQSVLLSLMSAETAQNTAEQQVTTGKVADDLSGYGASADALTASQSVQSRISTYLTNGAALSDQLSAQNQALTAYASATQGAASAVTEALATGDGSTLMSTLQSQLSEASSALNTQYNGAYLFSGGATTTQPVAATSLSDLAGGAAAAFQNGDVPQVSRLDDTTTVTTGVTASSVGTPLFAALSTIQNYVSANGPFTQPLTAAQTTFLQGMVTTMNGALSSANDAVAQTGVVQQQVTSVQTDLQDQATTLTNAIGSITDADAAQAATNLQLAQTALQASAQVFSTLKDSSLLNVLSSS